MYCSNQSSMATLLQQKIFMKNLTNGSNNVVVVNGTDDNQTTTLVAAGATMTTIPGAASRMLLPHETVVLPSLATTTLVHQQPLLHQQNTLNNAFTTTHSPASSTTISLNSSNSVRSFNSQFINHLQSNHHITTQQLFGNSSQQIVSTTAPTTSFQSPFNNAYADLNAIFRTAASSSPATTSIVSMQSFASIHQHQLPHMANSASSLVYVNGTQHNTILTPKQHQPSQQQVHSQTHPHQQQQTVSKSQTAENITAHTNAIKGTAVSDGCGERDNSTGVVTGTQDQSATATATDGLDTKTTDKEDDQDQEAEPEIDIVINNVVCSFSVRCHLNLRDIALKGFNVEFRRENGMVTMKLRRPYTTASIWSSGKITCTGATSEDQAKIAARRYSRCLQKLGFNARFRNFRIVNVLGTCSMPWGIMIVNFSEKYKKDASYEPELHPGVTYKLHNPKATLKIFSTGSITVTAASVAYVQAAIEHIFPLVYEFRKKRSPQEKIEMQKQTAFDPESLIEEDCDIVVAPTSRRIVVDDEDDEDGDVFDDDEDVILTNASGNNTKAINQLKGGVQKRPAGKADNDPTEDTMFVSDDDVDDMIESDED
ncbi:TATA-box-binding protein-like [Toxorhynchites rutilus septentrionalis]|uniref:TATA-box-binding protein-like n=1 Tax=Toxorhynchites rutilus septentrionalis TaxID=329112 RepID=UPI00247A27C6|nr:TATA-box-binding protein-like [Toxorhynchites rutilus septentrionalis]